MHLGVLLLQDDELLKVHEGKASVANEIGTLASIEVGIEEVLVDIDGNAEIGDGFLEHTQTGITPPSGQVVESISLIDFLNDSLEVTNGVEEFVHGEVKNASEEQYLVILWTILQSLIKVSLCISQHLHFSRGLQSFGLCEVDDAEGSEEEGVSFLLMFISNIGKERDRLLELISLKILKTLAQDHVEILGVVEFFNLG